MQVVEVTGMQPDAIDFPNLLPDGISRFCWLLERQPGSHGLPENLPVEQRLPKEVFTLLGGEYESAGVWEADPEAPPDEWCIFDTLEEAKAALSRALILWARIRNAAKAKAEELAEELADREPRRFTWCDIEPYTGSDFASDSNMIPREIYALLDAYRWRDDPMKTYDTTEDANAALRRAIDAWAKNHVLNAGKMVAAD